MGRLLGEIKHFVLLCVLKDLIVGNSASKKAAREMRTQDCIGAASQNQFCLNDFRPKLPVKGVQSQILRPVFLKFSVPVAPEMLLVVWDPVVQGPQLPVSARLTVSRVTGT